MTMTMTTVKQSCNSPFFVVVRCFNLQSTSFILLLRTIELEVFPLKKNILKVRKYGVIWHLSTHYVYDEIDEEIENIKQKKDLFDVIFCKKSNYHVIDDTSDTNGSYYDNYYDIRTHLETMIEKMKKFTKIRNVQMFSYMLAHCKKSKNIT